MRYLPYLFGGAFVLTTATVLAFDRKDPIPPYPTSEVQDVMVQLETIETRLTYYQSQAQLWQAVHLKDSLDRRQLIDVLTYHREPRPYVHMESVGGHCHGFQVQNAAYRPTLGIRN